MRKFSGAIINAEMLFYLHILRFLAIAAIGWMIPLAIVDSLLAAGVVLSLVALIVGLTHIINLDRDIVDPASPMDAVFVGIGGLGVVLGLYAYSPLSLVLSTGLCLLAIAPIFLVRNKVQYPGPVGSSSHRTKHQA